MNQPSRSDQETNPNPSVTSAQDAQPSIPQNAQGSAMLDANIEASKNQPEGEAIAHPTATNASDKDTTGVSKTADVSGRRGAFSTDDPSTEKGAVNLHNNPQVPSDRHESITGEMPDTDRIKRPIDPKTNLPD